MDTQYNNIYEVDLAILEQVKQGGGGGGGITSGQVETMIDDKLVDYSTTNEVEAMIAASGGGESFYVSVRSLSEVTSPTDGMVANVIDYEENNVKHLGTGEWIYLDNAWRPKNVWLDRLTTSELVAMYNYLHGGYANETPNHEHTCFVKWYYDWAEWPFIITSSGLLTVGSNVVTFTGIATHPDSSDFDSIHYASISSAGTVTKGYRQIPKAISKNWNMFEIDTDGEVVAGNGYYIMETINGLDYPFAYPYRNIKCTSNVESDTDRDYYGSILCGERIYDDELVNGRFTGIIEIGTIIYMGVWEIDNEWQISKINWGTVAFE